MNFRLFLKKSDDYSTYFHRMQLVPLSLFFLPQGCHISSCFRRVDIFRSTLVDLFFVRRSVLGGGRLDRWMMMEICTVCLYYATWMGRCLNDTLVLVVYEFVFNSKWCCVNGESTHRSCQLCLLCLYVLFLLSRVRTTALFEVVRLSPD